MLATGPTHIVVDHINGGGLGSLWTLLIGGGFTIVGVALGFLGNRFTGKETRRDEREHLESMRTDELRRSMVAAVTTATVRLSHALLREDNFAKDVALADSIAAFDILRVQFEHESPSFLLFAREQRNKLEADLIQPLAEGTGQAQRHPVKDFRERLQGWLHTPEQTEKDYAEGEKNKLEGERRQRQAMAEIDSLT